MRVCGRFPVPKSVDFLQISAGMRTSYSKVFEPLTGTPQLATRRKTDLDAEPARVSRRGSYFGSSTRGRVVPDGREISTLQNFSRLEKQSKVSLHVAQRICPRLLSTIVSTARASPILVSNPTTASGSRDPRANRLRSTHLNRLPAKSGHLPMPNDCTASSDGWTHRCSMTPIASISSSGLALRERLDRAVLATCGSHLPPMRR